MITDAGSKSKTYQEIQKAMLPMAAYFGSQVDKEMISLSGRVHREKAADWMNLVLDNLVNPGFREEDFNRLKTQAINGIQTDLKGNNDEELGKEVMYEQLYPNHPYGALNLGHVSDLESITLDDVKAFYQAQLSQKNLTLGITGNLGDTLKSELKNRLAKGLNVGQDSMMKIAAAPEFSGRHVTIVEKETMPTAVSFGFPIEVNRSHEDWVALWLVVGIVSVSIKSTPWTTAVVGLFQKSRGLALGLTLSGTAVAQSVVPPLGNFLITEFGWRGGFVWLGMGWGGITLLVCLLFFFDVRALASKQRKADQRAGRTPAVADRSGNLRTHQPAWICHRI